MNMDPNTVSRSHDRGVYAATALASAKDEEGKPRPSGPELRVPMQATVWPAPVRRAGVLGMERASSPKPAGKCGACEGFHTARPPGNPLLERVRRCCASESHPGGRRFESG
jgi:hypothetical protein